MAGEQVFVKWSSKKYGHQNIGRKSKTQQLKQNKKKNSKQLKAGRSCVGYATTWYPWVTCTTRASPARSSPRPPCWESSGQCSKSLGPATHSEKKRSYADPLDTGLPLARWLPPASVPIRPSRAFQLPCHSSFPLLFCCYLQTRLFSPCSWPLPSAKIQVPQDTIYPLFFLKDLVFFLIGKEDLQRGRQPERTGFQLLVHSPNWCLLELLAQAEA